MCSSQTASAIEMLMELYLETGNVTYLDPIPDAIDWLNSSDTTIPLTDYPGQYGWSRLYELETNKPIVGNRNNQDNGVEYYYEYDPERDYGYSWQGTYGINTTISNYLQLKDTFEFNREDYTNWRNTNAFNARNNEPDDETEQLSEEGFWINEENYITTSEFASKCQKYINYFQYLIDTQ